MRMTKKPSKPKMGRPPLPSGKRRGASMGFRPTPGIREKLVEAARANGRSMSQEVEARLEQSFLGDAFLGGLGNATAAKLIGPILEDVETRTGKSWREDKNTYYGAVVAVLAIMRVLGPRDVPHPKMAFDTDPDLDEHIISSSIDAVAKIAAGRENQRK